MARSALPGRDTSERRALRVRCSRRPGLTGRDRWLPQAVGASPLCRPLLGPVGMVEASLTPQRVTIPRPWTVGEPNKLGIGVEAVGRKPRRVWCGRLADPACSLACGSDRRSANRGRRCNPNAPQAAATAEVCNLLGRRTTRARLPRRLDRGAAVEVMLRPAATGRRGGQAPQSRLPGGRHRHAVRSARVDCGRQECVTVGGYNRRCSRWGGLQ